MTACTLCGLPTGSRPVREADLEGEFCCRGCLEVHRAVEGMSDADDTGPLESITPAELTDEIGATASASSAALSEAPLESDQGTLEPDQELPDGEFETAFLSLEGMHCTTCERFLEAVATKTDGISSARASYATEMIRLRYDPDEIERDELSAAISGFGYRAVEPAGERDDAGFDLGKYRTILAVLLAMPVMAPYLLFIYPTYLGIYPASFLYGSTVRLMVFVPLALWSTLIVLVLGYPIFRSAYVSLVVRRPTVDVLISIAVLAAYAYSFVALALGSRHVYFDVAVMVLVVVTVGNRVETTVKRRAVGTHAALAATRETTVQLLADDGSTSEVDRDACEPGERIIVTAGDRIPFDGRVVEGTGTVDEAFMTGEPVPLSASTGDAVIGGSILTDGTLVVEIDDTASTLDRLVELLWNVQSTDAGVQRLVNTFAVVFVPLVVVVAGAATALWLAIGQPPSEAILIGLSVLVVSCPCSLGIATPLALAAGSARAAENNTAVLSTNVLERITNSEIVVFDKTGTLTTGEMTVETVVADDPDAVLERAGAVESRSNHPIAAAIVDAAPAVDATVDSFDSGPRSVSATVDGKRVTVGHPETFRAESDRRSGSETWEFPDRLAEAVTSTREDGFQPTVVGWDGVVRGVVAIRDRPRDNWKSVVSTLSSEDRRIVVLTGDDERATRWLRSHPDVDDVFAGVRPESKEAILRRLREEGTTTMIGDGTNDAPALARADVGIALEEGTDIAVDAADVVVRDADLEAIPTFFAISRSTRRRIRQNLGWAVCYNIVAIPLAVAGLINPLIAAVMMGVSSLIVVINSGRGSLRRHSTKVADDSVR
ncbi:heavy-metal transporting CPx-type ATPase (plasmid) [Halostagnicola larsenii XH-48]|uniref:Heavy-metal transporting CPx-type ATPase n=1 Tax=Halostagnicola larsenii XH-48 TaxID=797299 RepID=W0JY83_9EURY|nr:cation-translocating P-type ATPase [Halostagnicola larsenii]AHG02232.1 heavy-metal transporting CPx-type ATPase [Halostagnicola larsenii XH-48]